VPSPQVLETGIGQSYRPITMVQGTVLTALTGTARMADQRRSVGPSGPSVGRGADHQSNAFSLWFRLRCF